MNLIRSTLQSKQNQNGNERSCQQVLRKRRCHAYTGTTTTNLFRPLQDWHYYDAHIITHKLRLVVLIRSNRIRRKAVVHPLNQNFNLVYQQTSFSRWVCKAGPRRMQTSTRAVQLRNKSKPHVRRKCNVIYRTKSRFWVSKIWNYLAVHLETIPSFCRLFVLRLHSQLAAIPYILIGLREWESWIQAVNQSVLSTDPGPGCLHPSNFFLASLDHIRLRKIHRLHTFHYSKGL